MSLTLHKSSHFFHTFLLVELLHADSVSSSASAETPLSLRDSLRYARQPVEWGLFGLEFLCWPWAVSDLELVENC